MRERREDHRWAFARIWGSVGGLSAILIFGGHFLADRYGALVGFFLALGLNAWVIWTVDWTLMHLFHSTELEGQDAWGIVSHTHALAARHSLPAPRVHILETSPTSYSAGLFASRTHLFISKSLLEKFTTEEVHAVVAVELARMSHQITSVATAASSLVNLIVGFSELVDRTLFLQAFRRDQPGQIRPMRLLSSPFAALILRTAMSHAQILRADRTAAVWIRSPHTVAQALNKLDSYQKTLPLLVGMGDAHLFTVSPLSRFGWCRIVSTQPDISARIAALTGHLYL